MSRKLRLKCPACQTLIETSVEEELRVTLQCAACHKQFTAKVPPRAGGAPQTGPVQPVVAARPVASSPVSASPVAASPVSARPVAARPVAAQPTAPQPSPAPQYYAPPPSPLADPLFDATNDFSFPVAPTAYQPVRKRKPINLVPIFKIAGGVVGVVLAVCLGLYGWHWAANTDWSTFSLTPDSHERLAADWFDHAERTANENLNMQSSTAVVDYEKFKALFLESGTFSETTLVRAVRIGKVPLEKKAPYQAKQEAFDKKFRESMDAKLAELKAANAKSPLDPARMMEIMAIPAIRDGVVMSSALAHYMGNAQFDLPAPQGDIEKIYYEEADLVHEYLKQLTLVRNTSQSQRVAEKIEGLSDKMMELATRRAKLPANRFEQVPREYVSKDKGFSVAQRALIIRIRRDAQPDEKLKDAVANFNDARDLLVEASGGKSDVELRSRFADFRKIRAASTLRGPGDLFHIETDQPQREMVVKPARDSQPDPVREPPKPEAKPQPAPETVASNTPPPAAAKPMPVEPTGEPKQSKTDSPATASVPSPLSPNMRDHFFRGMQAGMQGGMPGGIPNDPPVGNQRRTPSGVQQPNIGPPVDGQAMVFPSQGFGSDLPTFDKAESVKIILSKSSRDGNEIVKRLANGLQSNTYSMSGSNGQVTLQLKYAGELDAVVKLIDFGKVTLIDSPERTIHVSGE